MRPFVQALAVVLLAVVAFAADAYASQYFAGLLFPRIVPRPYTEMVSAALVGAIAAALLTAYPLARLFPRNTWLAGLLVAAPVIAIRTEDLLHYTVARDPAVIIMAWVEIVSFSSAVVFGPWLVSRHLAMSSMQPTLTRQRRARK